MPKVSVIIPNYNHAPYLEQRIHSVLNQTYQDFELILLDDCSNDNSREILESYRNHPKVSQVIFNETNSGTTFKQWQKGIELAEGEYIWIAESDDYCEKTLLETLIDGLIKQPSCTVAYCQSLYIKNSNEVFYFSMAKKMEEYVSGADYIRQRTIYSSSIYNASMAVFKKEAYYHVSADYMSFRFCGDWLFWSEIINQGDVFISGKLLNYFRFHDKDVSTGMYKTGRNFIEEFRCLLLLKERYQIPDTIYRNALAVYTTRFFVQKSKFDPETVKRIKTLLHHPENRKHRFYLRRKWLQNRCKRVLEKAAEGFGR